MACVGRIVTKLGKSPFVNASLQKQVCWFGASSRLYSAGQYENIKVEKRGEKQNVVLIQLNRPKALNALCDALMEDLDKALANAEADKDVGAIVITGSERAFAAGADIKEMQAFGSFSDVYNNNMLMGWDCVSNCKKPILAAVNGFALVLTLKK